MNICTIPARGGSKRIPLKNIKPFDNKPIIAYSIKAALKSNCFDLVIVSTDDNQIAEVAKKYGAQVPFLRPEDLSDDFTGTIPVVKHTIEWVENNISPVEDVCCLYATAPFIQPKTIFQAYKKLKELKSDYCVSVTSFSSPIQRSIRISQDNEVSMFYPENFYTRSQDLELAYHDAGQFYWGRAEVFKQQKPLFTKNTTPYILPRYLVQDIDTPEDWKRAELIFQILKQDGEMC